MKVPQKITPCPIIEAIIEMRFFSEMPSDAIFGVVYNEFKNEYSQVEKLPILQFPDEVRSNDINLKFLPHYKLIQDDYILQIGPNVLSIANTNEYHGWTTFSSKIKETFNKVNKLGIIKKYNRLGIRYINFFELNIYDNINLEILLKNQQLKAEQITLRTTIKAGNFLTNLQIINNGNIITQNIPKTGSLIDIDIYIQDENKINFSNINDLLEEGHKEEKNLFFTVLTDEFLKKFNPEY